MGLAFVDAYTAGGGGAAAVAKGGGGGAAKEWGVEAGVNADDADGMEAALGAAVAPKGLAVLL